MRLDSGRRQEMMGRVESTTPKLVMVDLLGRFSGVTPGKEIRFGVRNAF
jgi:hypothetical protein